MLEPLVFQALGFAVLCETNIKTTPHQEQYKRSLNQTGNLDLFSSSRGFKFVTQNPANTSKDTFFTGFLYKAFILQGKGTWIKRVFSVSFLTGLTDPLFLGRSRTRRCLNTSQQWIKLPQHIAFSFLSGTVTLLDHAPRNMISSSTSYTRKMG